MAKSQNLRSKKEVEVADAEALIAEELNDRMIHMIVFRMGNEEYGIRIEQVKEVTVTPPIARVPRTPVFVKGVANIRGDIISLMDLEERFHIRDANEAPVEKMPSSYTLVIDADQFTVGLLVREVPQSLTIPVSKIDTTLGLIKENALQSNFIDGVANLNDRLIIVLDMDKILSSDEVHQLHVSES